MAHLRGKQTRRWTLALVLIALAVQTFAVGMASSAMAARAAKVALVNAELAPLGLTLAEVPCHSGFDAALLPSDEKSSGHHAKKECLACTAQAVGSAVLPEAAAFAPPILIAAPLIFSAAAAPRVRAGVLPQARAPPAAA